MIKRFAASPFIIPLTAALLLCGIPAARADDFTVGTEAELRAALNTAGASHTIILDADIDVINNEVTEQNVVIDGKNITFVLNDYRLRFIDTNDADDGAALTVTNGSVVINGGGVLTVHGEVCGLYVGSGGSGTGAFAAHGGIGFTVTFETGGGSKVPGQSVVCGGRAIEPAPPVREGYMFGGWYADQGLQRAFSFDTAIIKRPYTPNG